MLSEAVQDYLKVIYKLSRAPEAAAMVSTTLIAERMEVSAASATNMIKKLAELRLLEHRPYQGVELTPSGVKMALEIVRHHRLLELYLRQALGYNWDTVDAEAERLEHAISEDFEDRIDEALGFPTVGAHGEPIPTKDGNIAEPEYSRLADLREGQRACIRQVSDRDPELLRYLDRSGLVLGTRIRISEKAPFRGPIRL
ncbi:uncharacterized protein METZ01_LOCUS286910, partial [marine metagenome]